MIETYRVKKAFPMKGRIAAAGEEVQMHPRQAKYLIGSHLERLDAQAPVAKRTGKGAKNDGGDI